MFLLPLLMIVGQVGRAEEIPAPRAEYFLSESRMLSPDGKPLGIIAGIVRRDYRPAEGIIEEMAIALDPTPDAVPTVVHIEWKVEGDTATITEANQRIKGRGRLVGPPWRWTDWAWNVTMKDIPGTFRNTAKVNTRGLAIRSVQVDDKGKTVSTFEQIDTRITKETYDVLRGKFVPQ
jgi:hypothetical protein